MRTPWLWWLRKGKGVLFEFADFHYETTVIAKSHVILERGSNRGCSPLVHPTQQSAASILVPTLLLVHCIMNVGRRYQDDRQVRPILIEFC